MKFCHKDLSLSRLIIACAVIVSVALVGCGGGSDSNDVFSDATATDLDDRQFVFSDGTVFGLSADEPVTLAFDNVADTNGEFTLSSASVTASGTVTIGSCILTVTQSSNPSLIAVGEQFNFPVCQVSDDGTQLQVIDDGGASASSNPGGSGQGNNDTGSTGSTGG